MAAKQVKAPEPLVRIVEVLVELAGDGNPDAWHAEAEQLAETMRAAVTRDWRGHPCLGWVDAERLLLRMRRDRAQRNEEIEARVVAAAEARLAAVPRGIPLAEMVPGVTPAEMLFMADPMRSRRRSVVEDALQNDDALVYHPVGGES